MTMSPEDLHPAFQEAFNRHDLESIVALYERDAVFASFGGPVQGTNAIRERYSDALARCPIIDVETLRVTVAADLAVLQGKWVLYERGGDGRRLRREGWNTETARRQADGRWLFVIDLPSISPD